MSLTVFPRVTLDLTDVLAFFVGLAPTFPVGDLLLPLPAGCLSVHVPLLNFLGHAGGDL